LFRQPIKDVYRYFYSKDKIGDAEQGDVVLVHIEDWPSKADSPFGKVIKVLGKPGEHDTEIHAILAEYGLPSEFPIEVKPLPKN
jgi:ribonuclease R